MPTQILTGGVYVLTQGTGPYSLNDSLAGNLSRQAWAAAVSAEVLGLGTLQGQAILVRGAEPAAFLTVDGGAWVQGGPGNGTWAAPGVALHDRIGIEVGATITLTGSSIPRLALAPVTGVFRTGLAEDDELLVDLPLAHFLTGVPAGVYHAIRVRTSDPAALLAYLQSFGASVHVTGPSGVAAGANTAPATDPRLVNLYLLHGQGALPADYLTEGLNEATNSVRLVAFGLAVLVILLAAAAVHAIQARVFADRRAAVGTLRALGAGPRWMVLRMAREALPGTALAILFGTAAGVVLAASLGSTSTVLVFGHSVRVSFDPVAEGLLAAIVMGVAVASWLLLLRGAMRDRPGESFRDQSAEAPPESLEVVLRS